MAHNRHKFWGIALDILQAMRERVLLYDGAKSAFVVSLSSTSVDVPDIHNISNPNVVREVYRTYYQAGSDCLQTLTYNSNRVKLHECGMEDKLREIIDRSIGLAREVVGDKCYVIGTAGPLGKLLRPIGDLTIERTYELFAEQLALFEEFGADAIHLDGFKSMKELKVALMAAKENTRLPIICGVSVEKNGKTLMGEDICSMAVTMKSLGADVISLSDGDGAASMVRTSAAAAQSGQMLCVRPNAGTPYIVGDRLVSPDGDDAISQFCEEYIHSGARLIGGTFGTSPRTIEIIKETLDNVSVPVWTTNDDRLHPWLTGGNSRVRIDRSFQPLSVHEVIGPEPVIDLDDMFDVIREIAGRKCDVLYLDVDKAMDEELPIEYVLGDMQTYIKRPIVFRSSNAGMLEKAVRSYNGRPGIVTDSDISAGIARKYGCLEFSNSLC